VPLRRALDHLRAFLGLPPRRRPPLTEEDRIPLRGEGRVRDPGHQPESGRAPCGRPHAAPRAEDSGEGQ
jgi:hypothetical protein